MPVLRSDSAKASWIGKATLPLTAGQAPSSGAVAAPCTATLEWNSMASLLFSTPASSSTCVYCSSIPAQFLQFDATNYTPPAIHCKTLYTSSNSLQNPIHLQQFTTKTLYTSSNSLQNPIHLQQFTAKTHPRPTTKYKKETHIQTTKLKLRLDGRTIIPLLGPQRRHIPSLRDRGDHCHSRRRRVHQLHHLAVDRLRIARQRR